MKHLHFVRHGESVLNRERIFAGQTDTPLTDHGRDEARAAGELAGKYHFDLIVSSPLVRALETSQIIAKVINYPQDKIIVNDVFMELAMGSLGGKPWDAYNGDEFSSGLNDVEAWEHLLTRSKNGLEFLKSQPEESILLVGHGTFARALRTAIDPDREYPEPQNAEFIQLL